MTTDLRTPVLIGVGQSVDRLDAPDYYRWSASDLAAVAAERALADTGAADSVRRAIGVIATTRTFEDSGREPATFGKSSNFPRSVSTRLGIDPPDAVWAKIGGNTPQDLVAELSGRIADAEYDVALICGGEAISTVRAAAKAGVTLDFSETPDGTVEDRGAGRGEFADAISQRHGVTSPVVAYALLENARRASLGVDRESYAWAMGRLFAPFAAIAHENPRASFAVPAYSAQDIAVVGPHNRWVATPYPLRMVARDQVNLGAALIVASLGAARRLGVPEDRFVYLHGAARTTERHLPYRPDLGQSPAARVAARAAVDQAQCTVSDIGAFDFYSCFPIAVANVACDAFGIAAEDPRGLTVTGGLPYFGGPGNNYSMHAIAEMVERLRRERGRFGFIGANGGYLSKYSAGVYSTAPVQWRGVVHDGIQGALDAAPGVRVHDDVDGVGRIETFTVQHGRQGPVLAVVIGRMPDGGRFIARTAPGDQTTLFQMMREDCFGRECRIVSGAYNQFTLV